VLTMTSPDPRDRGLDPAHILGVCVLATIGRHDHRMLTISTPAGVRVTVPTRRAAGDVLAALTLTGYQAIPVASGGRGRALLVAGWSPAGLDARLTAMRAVIQQLDAGSAITASAAISRVRRPPASSPAAGPDQDALGWARSRLRAWVAARSGIHAPRNPAILPADLGNALRLRAAWAVEAVIDDLIERHLLVARHALRLFGSLRQNASDDWAQEAAVRQAGITFHLSGPASQDSPAQDSSALIQRAGRPQRPARPPASGAGPSWPGTRRRGVERRCARQRAADCRLRPPPDSQRCRPGGERRSQPGRKALPRPPPAPVSLTIRSSAARGRTCPWRRPLALPEAGDRERPAGTGRTGAG
jgi:hypothetical protein